ncbi:DUF4886 domain-containing protein [Cerasicoccus frondis]|uniref:DUF4886 domain-containing protein n=1 Tax=Cerasicoccus frondis TaxID=490090 RepID=UPI002852A8E5|nr:DUF4886 domain-containing protein [Cerasicoccus frondis]
MNNPRLAFFIALLLSLTPVFSAETQTTKILGIGNSFTLNAFRYLKDICDSADSVNVDVCSATISGCSLERHVQHAKEQEADPQTGKAYVYRANWRIVGKEMSLKEILLAEDWDIISIQQVSILSYKSESYDPYGEELIAYCHQYCPNAEIVVHETWSHSVNSPRAKSLINPDEMYDKLHAAYQDLAKKNNLRLIPSGTAFQNARATEMWDLAPINFDPKNHGLTYPEDKDKLPGMSKSLNKDFFWKKTDEGWVVTWDGFHANTAGEYLAGLVWFQMVTGRPATEVTFKPDSLSTEQAESLRQVAKQSVESLNLASYSGPRPLPLTSGH